MSQYSSSDESFDNDAMDTTEDARINNITFETVTPDPINSFGTRSFLDTRPCIANPQNLDSPHILLDEKYAAIDDVPGLNTNLYLHQKIVVKAMLDIENAKNYALANSLGNPDPREDYYMEANAAILSEKVGSGKTFDILATILLQPCPQRDAVDICRIWHGKLMYRDSKTSSQNSFIYKKKIKNVLRPTLVFVGSGVVRQWIATVNQFTNLKMFAVLGLREFETLIRMIADKTVDQYDIIVLKNGTIARPVLPKNVKLFSCNNTTTPHIYSLLANITGVCWPRVVIDDFDVIHLKDSSPVIPAVFTWYVSSTVKPMKIPNLENEKKFELYPSLSKLLVAGNYNISGITGNKLLYRVLNVRNLPKFVDTTSQLSKPRFYMYRFKNPNRVLLNVLNEVSAEMRQVVEMINADAIETAAERLNIKTTTTAGIFEKILGDQYNELLFLNKILKFIEEQQRHIHNYKPGFDSRYTVRDLEEFKPIMFNSPHIVKFLDEQHKKYTEWREKAMTTVVRIKDHLTEGECPICMLELKDECGGKILIFKCCSIIVCEPCCFNTVFRKRHIANCPNCRAQLTLRELIYIGQELDLDKIISDMDAGNIEAAPEPDAAAADAANATDAADATDAANATNTAKPIAPRKQNYGKYDAIVDIIRGNAVPTKSEVHINIPQLMVGPATFSDAQHRKVLVFANYDETLRKIKEVFAEEKVQYEMLGGTSAQIADIVHRFATDNQHNVLLINSLRHCSGLNLQMATDLIFTHLMIDDNIETQVAGRLVRLGRKTNAYFHYVMYENEYDQKMATGRMRTIVPAAEVAAGAADADE